MEQGGAQPPNRIAFRLPGGAAARRTWNRRGPAAKLYDGMNEGARRGGNVIAGFLVLVLGPVALWANAELLVLFMDIERNTRKLYEVLANNGKNGDRGAS
jgi:hypothetical protein